MAESTAKQFVFKWQGTNRDGAVMQGKTEASNLAAVKARLRQQGINPKRIRKQTTLFGIGGGQRRKRIRPVDIAVFARQCATMLGAGVALVQTLELIAKGEKNATMADLVNDIRNRVESGSTLAEALAAHPKQFDELFVNLVAAGEASGTLETLLAKIASYKEKTEAIKAKVRKAMYYPTAIIIAAFIVMAILLYYVVPQFQSLFQGFGAELPAFTLMVVGMSNTFREWWWVILLGIVAAVFLFRYVHSHSYGFRRTIDRILIKLPIIGNILYKSIVARFARTMATMFAAGVPLVDALESVGGAAGNIIFAEGIRQMRTQIETGQRLQVALANTGLFPSMTEQMIAIGEESGSLDVMCTRVADVYEQEVDDQVDALSSLLEPLIMVVIGTLVGGIVIAMYLPIFKLGSVV